MITITIQAPTLAAALAEMRGLQVNDTEPAQVVLVTRPPATLTDAGAPATAPAPTPLAPVSNGKPPRVRRTRAQIEADELAAAQATAKSIPLPREVDLTEDSLVSRFEQLILRSDDEAAKLIDDLGCDDFWAAMGQGLHARMEAALTAAGV